MSVVEAECTIKRKHNNETEEAIFNSVFNLFTDFANKAETIVPDQVPPGSDDEGEEEEEVEVQPDMFEKLEVEDQEDVIKEVFGEIVWNLLGKLPKEGKEAFLAKCFKELLEKLPRESQVEINAKVKDKTTTLIQETARPHIAHFPTDGLAEVGFRPECVRAKPRKRINIRSPKVVRDDKVPNGGQSTTNGNPGGRGRR